MIRDGRMPSPEQAWAIRIASASERCEKRERQPAQIRKREEQRRAQEARTAAYMALWEAEKQDKAQPPLEEALADAFDFTDPELRKSNSWAILRPRLIVHQSAVVARLESRLVYTIDYASKQHSACMPTRNSAKRNAKAIWPGGCPVASALVLFAEPDFKLPCAPHLFVRQGFDPVGCSPHPLSHLLEDGEQLIPRIAARRLERLHMPASDLGLE
jgi:hypothetical protein